VRRVSDRTLVQAILFFGFVSFMLGKKALEGTTNELATLRRAA